jgi:hypothetical protein
MIYYELAKTPQYMAQIFYIRCHLFEFPNIKKKQKLYMCWHGLNFCQVVAHYLHYFIGYTSSL